jgi:hypothetical protein
LIGLLVGWLALQCTCVPIRITKHKFDEMHARIARVEEQTARIQQQLDTRLESIAQQLQQLLDITMARV